MQCQSMKALSTQLLKQVLYVSWTVCKSTTLKSPRGASSYKVSYMYTMIKHVKTSKTFRKPNTVNPVQAITCLKQPSAFQDQYLVTPNVYIKSKLICIKEQPVFTDQHFDVPNVHINTKLTCIREPPAFESILLSSLNRLLKTGLTAYWT